MNLEEIINAAVEKRIKDMLDHYFENCKKQYGDLQSAVKNQLLVEFEKRQPEIKARIEKAVADFDPARIKFSVYAQSEV